jgi:Histidine-specific methyltransferase, SAM-dependent
VEADLRFEHPRHGRDFATYLRLRRVPTKYGFSGSAAPLHEQLTREASYQSVANALEVELEVARPSQATMVCDLGPGPGQHSVSFLQQHTAGREHGPLRYLALDFSEINCRLTLAAIRADFDGIDARASTWDLEDGPTDAVREWRDDGAGPVLVLFLGHTIGNPFDPAAVLRNIRGSLARGDEMVISVALYQTSKTAEEYVATYGSRFVRESLLAPFAMFGIPTDEARFALEFTQREVRGYVSFPSAVLSPEGDQLVPPGQRIQCFRSARFLTDEIDALLRSTGWDLLSSACSQDRSHYAVRAVVR